MKKKTIILTILIIILLIVSSIFIYNIIINNSKNNENINIGEQQNNEEKNDILFSQTIEATYSKDPKIPENLLDVVDTHILKIKVSEILEAKILPKMENYYNPYQPCTPIKVELIENLYGEDIVLKDDIIYMQGGKIRISELIKHLDDVDIERMGLNTLTKEEKENKFIKYSTEYSTDIQEGKEYVVIIGKMDNGVYTIVDEGCGIFVAENINLTADDTSTVNQTNGIVLKNIFTNKKINQTELLKKAEEKNKD